MLNEKAIFAKFQASAPGEQILAKKETDYLLGETGASRDCMKAIKKKWGNNPILENRRKVVQKARIAFNQYSAAWDEWRILPNPNMQKTIDTNNAFKEEAKVYEDEFILKLPEIINEAKAKLGTAFDEADYPTAEQIKEQFTWRLDMQPIPDTSSDFRIGLTKEDEEKLRQMMEAEYKDKIQDTSRDVMARVMPKVERLKDRMDTYFKDDDGKSHNYFRDGLIDNMREVAGIVSMFNVTDDPAWDRLSSDILTSLAKYSPQALRNDSSLRREVSRSAEKIIKDVATIHRRKVD